MRLFKKGKICIIAKFHRTDIVIYSHSRVGKTPSYRQIWYSVYVGQTSDTEKLDSVEPLDCQLNVGVDERQLKSGWCLNEIEYFLFPLPQSEQYHPD